jgi:hypothetical protein
MMVDGFDWFQVRQGELIREAEQARRTGRFRRARRALSWPRRGRERGTR